MHGQKIANLVRMQAAMAAGALARPRLGLVSSYKPETYSVKVRIQPEDIETGWLPIVTLLAGAGWGVYAGPAVGDQAVVLHQEDDREAGFCVGFLPSDEDRPPSVASGDILVKHKTGGLLRFSPGGVVAMEAPGGLNITGDVTITGKVDASGDITSSQTVTGNSDVKTGSISLKNHKHPGVQSGGAQTGSPI